MLEFGEVCLKKTKYFFRMFNFQKALLSFQKVKNLKYPLKKGN